MSNSVLTNAPLGWGIIGSADGYQYSVQGLVENQLKCAQYWDLDSQKAVVLPAADLESFEPLYAMRFKRVNNISVAVVAQYLSIRQQGSYRSGTFFGSFVETAGCWFSSENVNEIMESLRQLSGYQLQHFIDYSKRNYTKNIKNQPFQSPVKELENIASGLRECALPISGSKVLVIDACEMVRGEIEALSYLLSTPYLATEFTDIYFSSSKLICEKFKTLPDVQYITLRGFKTYLSMFNLQLEERRKLNNQNKAEKSNFEQIKAGLENTISNYEQNLAKMNEQTKIELQNQFNAQVKQAEQQIDELNTKLQRSEEARKDSQQKSAILDQISQIIVQHTNVGGEQQQKIQQLIHQNQNLKQQLEQVSEQSEMQKQDIRRLKSDLQSEMNKASVPNYGLLRKLSVFRWGTIVLTGLLVISLGGIAALISSKSDLVSKSDLEKLRTEKQTLEAEKNRSESKLNNEKIELTKQLTTVTNEIKELCKMPQKGKDKVCNSYK